jgi:hypothetical protein
MDRDPWGDIDVECMDGSCSHMLWYVGLMDVAGCLWLCLGVDRVAVLAVRQRHHHRRRGKTVRTQNLCRRRRVSTKYIYTICIYSVYYVWMTRLLLLSCYVWSCRFYPLFGQLSSIAPVIAGQCVARVAEVGPPKHKAHTKLAHSSHIVDGRCNPPHT